VTAPQAAGPTPPASPREEWDRLALHRADELSKDLGDYLRQGSTEEEAAQEAQADAALILAAATEFADAVDRSGKGIPYEDAVVVEGSAGPHVCTAEEWRNTPIMQEVIAAGGHGRVDRVEEGWLLLRYLRTGEHDGPGRHGA
jgi:hypothetical protein